MDSSPSSTSVKLSHLAVFPTPPAVPQQAMALPTEMDNVEVAIMRQERDVDMSGIETRLEHAIMKRMEQRLEEVARQGRRKEQTDMVVSGLTSSITKRMEQVVSQEMKRMLPSLVSRGMEGVERDMVTKLGGLESRLVEELATSQSREAIGRAVAKGVAEMIDGSYRQAGGFERGMVSRTLSMLQQISEQFMAGSMRLLWEEDGGGECGSDWIVISLSDHSVW